MNPGPSSPADSSHPEVRIVNPQGMGELVMVVDDEPSVSLLAEMVLASKGYRIVTARDGFQALEIFGKLRNEIQIAVIDFMMPGMDGATLLRELRRINPRLPIVIISGFTTQDQLGALVGAGACGFFPKPLAPVKLLAGIREALDAAASDGGSGS